MPRPKAKAPARRHHISGHSIVTIDGRDFYLGPHDSPTAIARYAALVALYQTSGLSLPDGFELASLDPQVAMLLGTGTAQPTAQAAEPVLVRHITAGYRLVVETKYSNHPAERSRTLKLCDEVDEQAGDIPADKYGPIELQDLRAKWFYRPAKHKTANRGKKKAVPLIGDAREALTDYLNRKPDEYCFQPKESVAWWQSIQ